MQAIRTCTHTRATAGLDNAYCPDCKRTFKPKTKQYKEILERPPETQLLGEVECSQWSISLPELEGQQLPLMPSESPPQNLLKSTKTLNPSCDRTSPIFPSHPISETTNQNQDETKSIGFLSPAREQVQQEQESDLTIQNQLCGENPLDASVSDDPNLSLWNSLKDLSNEDFEQCLGDSEWQDIVSTTRNSYQQRNSEQCTIANEFLSCPTLTSGSKTPNSRAAGTTKCEMWFKQQGLVPSGYQLSAPAMAKLMGHQEDWFKALCPSPPELKAELKLDTLPEDVCVPLKPESPSIESSTSIPLQELTYDEEKDRHRLELKVERAFYEAGSALREIRDRKLYRSTHKTFESYCKDRFGFRRSHSYQLIDASGVVDNLLTNGKQNKMSANGGQNETRTNCSQILPTSERQVRALVSLPPDEQRSVWTEAVEQSNGKIPTGAKVKGIVEQLKERNITPPPPQYKEGDVIEVCSGGSSTIKQHNGMWGIVTHIGTWSYKVYISLRDTEIQCKGDEMSKVDEKYTADIRAVSDRIKRLRECSLDAAEYAVLQVIAKNTCFSPKQIALLEFLEGQYGIK